MHAVDRHEVTDVRSVSNCMHAFDRHAVTDVLSESNYTHAVDRHEVLREPSLGRALILERSRELLSSSLSTVKIIAAFLNGVGTIRTRPAFTGALSVTLSVSRGQCSSRRNPIESGRRRPG
jgi:hypothetical protein